MNRIVRGERDSRIERAKKIFAFFASICFHPATAHSPKPANRQQNVVNISIGYMIICITLAKLFLTWKREKMEMRAALSIGKKRRGFTLIELLIAVAIVAILAGVAFPSYRQYIIRSNRAAAQAEMMNIASIEQQYFVANRTYVDTAGLAATGYTLPSKVSSSYTFNVALGAGTVPSFTITFTPTGSQTSDGNLTLDSAGNKSPTGKW